MVLTTLLPHESCQHHLQRSPFVPKLRVMAFLLEISEQPLRSVVSELPLPVGR